jgi:cupin fold WbuC family metalloprotein
MTWIDRPLLDAVTAEATRSPRLRKNRNFHGSNEDRCHRLLNAVEPGSYVRPHRHADPEKGESILVLAGRLGIVLYGEDGRIERAVVAGPAEETIGVDLPAGTFHTLVALDPGTVFFEAKGGPWAPLTPEEKAPWAPDEGEVGAAEELAKLEALFRG